MTVRCEVCGQLPLQGSPRSFFPWPTDSSQRTYWQTCLGLQVVDLNKSDLFICSDHFDSMQMIRKGTALRKDAFPKRYMGPLPIFAPEDESPKIETLLDTTAVKNEDGIFGGAGPSAPIFDDEEIMPEELSMAKLVQMFAAAAKERPPTIVPLVTPIAEETKAFSNILIDRQEKYLNSYCKSCLRQAELVNMLEANCEGVPVSLMYKTVFMSEINGTEVPQMMCATCIGLLFQCFKFSTMTVRSCEVLQAARERFKYLPAIDDGTIDLKNIPQKYSAKSSAIQPVIQSDGEDTKEDITVAKKRKSVVKAKEVPEKKGRRTSSRKASEKAKKVSKKILEESEDEESNDIFDNDDADPDFDTAAYEVKDESPEVSEAEEDNKEGDNTEEDPEDNYCMLCRHSFSNMVRHMDKVHRVDWESKSCERYTVQKRKAPKRVFKQKNKKEQLSPKFNCNLCGYESTHFKEFFNHIQNEHRETLRCPLCEENFSNNFLFLAHLKVHGKSLYCSQHYMAFESRVKFLSHIKTPGHDLECGICFKILPSLRQKHFHKRAHLLKNRRKKGEYKCPSCPLVYGYRANLYRHIKTFHEKRVFLCEDCGTPFKTKFDLGKHFSLKHDKDSVLERKPFQCEFCGKKFHISGDLKVHRAMHLGRNEICWYCKESFDSPEKLQEHIETLKHHLFQCNKCSASFKAKAHLITHLLKHDSLKSNAQNFKQKTKELKLKKEVKYPRLENGKYPCKVCSKQFGSASNLMRHLDLHTGIRKYKCDKCGKAFRQQIGLKNHLSVHSEERPYECPICGSRFKDSSTFCKHKKVHGENSQAGTNFTPRRPKNQKKENESESQRVGIFNREVVENVEENRNNESIRLAFEDRMSEPKWLPHGIP